MKNSKFPKMHVSLYVANVEKTVAFYNTFFGKAADKQKADYAKYILEEPSLIISFVQNKERVQQNFGHLGFQVETKEQLERSLAYSKKHGLEVLEEMGTNCCYANQDKYWVRDPDGVQWEVYYFHEDVEFNDPHYSSQEATACCTPPVQQKPKIKLSDLNNTCCEPNSGCC